MADKLTPLLLAGLSRAAAAGLPLHGTRTVAGLFPTSATGKQAAQKCCADGFLAVVPEEAPEPSAGGTVTVVRKKAAVLYTITDAGLDFLLKHVSPRPVLEEFLAVLRSREGELAGLCDLTRRSLTATEGLRLSMEKVLDHDAETATAPGGKLKAMLAGFLGETSCNGAPANSAALESCLLTELGRWQQSGACEDYPLPNLYRHAAEHTPGLTIGAFHDALRRLHETDKIYLHPWSGPLYELPEPPCALLVGHEIAYYASLK